MLPMVPNPMAQMIALMNLAGLLPLKPRNQMTYTLKEQALALLKSLENSEDACCSWDFTTISKALESIPDKE
jgi:hypothetical protein